MRRYTDLRGALERRDQRNHRQPSKLSGRGTSLAQSERACHQSWQVGSSPLLDCSAVKNCAPPLSTVNVAGAVTPIAVDVKLLGVTLDQHLTFNKHIQNVCRSSYYHIRALKHIRSSLSEDVAKTIACAFVSSRLDYSNSVLFGISKSNISRLQRVQNSLARVVTRSRRNERITPIPQATPLASHQLQDSVQNCHIDIQNARNCPPWTFQTNCRRQIAEKSVALIWQTFSESTSSQDRNCKESFQSICSICLEFSPVELSNSKHFFCFQKNPKNAHF